MDEKLTFKEEIRRTWKWGVPLVVLLAIVGLLAGFAIDKAMGVTAATVKTAVIGVDCTFSLWDMLDS